MASVSKYDPDQPRDDHGMWAGGGGGGGGGGGQGMAQRTAPGGDLHERVSAAVRDRAFARENHDRLQAAGDEVRAQYPRAQQATDMVHNQAQEAIRTEAGRILVEHEAIAGSTGAHDAAHGGRWYSRTQQGGDLAAQHEAAMQRIAEYHAETQRQAEEQARFDHAERAGAVPAAPTAADEHDAVIAGHDAQVDAIHRDLQSAHEDAIRSLAELHGKADEETLDELPSHTDLAEHYLAADNALGGKDETGERYEHIADAVPEHEGATPHEQLNFDDEDKVEPWSPRPDGYTQEQADTLYIDDETGHADPWSHEHFNDSGPLSSDKLSHLEWDDEGKPVPASETGLGGEHLAEYQRQEALYNQTAAEHKSTYERVAADYERHAAADKADYEHHAAAYTAARARNQEEVRVKALETQSRLEALHTKQTAALQQLKEIDRAGDKARDAHEAKLPDDDQTTDHVAAMPPFRGQEVDDEGYFRDPDTQKLYVDARDAYEAKVGAAIDRINERRSRSGEDEQDALKEAIGRTTKAIRELSRFTGRAPNIAKPPGKGKTKKSAHAIARKAEWEEDKHPRGHGGKFTEGGGEDHEARANEHEAIAAGHVSSEVRDIADRHVAAHAKVAEHIAALDALHHDAAHALASLHEYSSPHHEDLDFEHHDLHEHFTETQDHLDPERTGAYATGGPQREAPIDPEDAPHLVAGYQAHPDDLPEHERPTGEARARMLEAHEAWIGTDHHEAWLADAKAKYNAAMKPHYAEYQRRADVAQAALEALHERQVAAHADMKEFDRSDAAGALERMSPEKQVNEAAFAHHARDENGDILDDSAAADYAVAHDAAESMYQHATARVEEHTHSELGDALESLKHETRGTASALKELGKITGRKPKLPAKAKKSANRPGSALGGSVWGMAAPNRFKLSLKSLQWISLVDTPAQEPAAIRLIKRRDGVEQMDATLTARVVKWSEGPDPLVYGWAFTCTDGAGQPYHDLQGDAVQPDFLKAAEEWLRGGGGVDEMHAGEPAGSHAAFAFPWDADIASAMLGPEVGRLVKTSGLMIAVRPTAEQLEKLRNKEYNGFSIAGTGIRELVKAAQPKCPSCSAYNKADAATCASCGKTMKRARPPVPARGVRVSTLKAVLATADRDALPDGSFLYIEPGGSKDADGKTTPRALRMFPYRDSSGTIDIVHLRNVCQEIPKSSLPKDLQAKLQVKAEKLLAAQHTKAEKRGVRKQPVLTSVVDGHQHQIDLDDPADEWRGAQLTTSYNTADGAEQGHSHAWIYDDAGKITVALDSGHTHTVDAVVPADVIAQAKLNESGERCGGCGAMCADGCRFCPRCGAAMDRRDAVPVAPADDKDSGPEVIVISAWAPRAISTPTGATSTVKGRTEEQPMADPTHNDEVRTLKAQVARLEKMNQLTDAQRVHFEKLKGGDADQFLALAPHQRQAVIDDIAKADDVVYTSTETGKEYRKSCPPEIIEAVIATDAAKKLAREHEVGKQELAYAKRGDEALSHFAKGLKGDLRARLIRAVTKEFTVPAEFDEAMKALKGADAAFATLSKAIGTNEGGDASDAKSPSEAWEAGLSAFAKDKNIANPLDAIVPFIKTDTGRALKKALDAQRSAVGQT